MSIKNAIKLIPEKIEGLIEDYLKDLEQAWVNCGEDPLTISFSVKIGVQKGKNVCEVSISFTKERVRDSTTFYWDPNQGQLFSDTKKLDDDLKKSGTSMTFIANGHDPVTLGAKN